MIKTPIVSNYILGRGYFGGLWLVVPLRVFLTVLMALEFWFVVRQKRFSFDFSSIGRKKDSTKGW